MAKILLVEDDISLREIYAARLQAEGYQVSTASDGEEALAVAVKDKPDLVVLDVMMPKISGFDVLDILRSTPETKYSKIIMMTALSQQSDRERGERLGADKYLVKSQVTLEDVVNAIRELLNSDGSSTQPAVASEAGQTTPATPEQNADASLSTPPMASAAPNIDAVQSATNELKVPQKIDVSIPEINDALEPEVNSSSNNVEPNASNNANEISNDMSPNGSVEEAKQNLDQINDELVQTVDKEQTTDSELKAESNQPALVQTDQNSTNNEDVPSAQPDSNLSTDNHTAKSQEPESPTTSSVASEPSSPETFGLSDLDHPPENAEPPLPQQNPDVATPDAFASSNLTPNSTNPQPGETIMPANPASDADAHSL